jgi:GNAT superfamily N-acetyltransferase
VKGRRISRSLRGVGWLGMTEGGTRRWRTEAEVEVVRGGTDGIGNDPEVEKDAGTGLGVAIDIGTDADTRIVGRGGLEVAVAKEETGDIEAEVRIDIEKRWIGENAGDTLIDLEEAALLNHAINEAEETGIQKDGDDFRTGLWT